MDRIRSLGLMCVRWRMVKISSAKGVLYEAVLIKDPVVSNYRHIGLWGCVFYTSTCSLSLSLSHSHTNIHTLKLQNRNSSRLRCSQYEEHFTKPRTFHEVKSVTTILKKRKSTKTFVLCTHGDKKKSMSNSWQKRQKHIYVRLQMYLIIWS